MTTTYADGRRILDADSHVTPVNVPCREPGKLGVDDPVRSGRATGFADNQAFVGVLSTMLLHREMQCARDQPASGVTRSSLPLAASSTSGRRNAR